MSGHWLDGLYIGCCRFVHFYFSFNSSKLRHNKSIVFRLDVNYESNEKQTHFKSSKIKWKCIIFYSHETSRLRKSTQTSHILWTAIVYALVPYMLSYVVVFFFFLSSSFLFLFRCDFFFSLF